MFLILYTPFYVVYRSSARLRRAFGIMILMGLTWAFGFGSVTNARLEFSYLFSISNASQGFFIFIFYCVAQKRARAQWYVYFKLTRNQYAHNVILTSLKRRSNVIREVKQKFLNNVPAADSHPNYFGISLSY